MVKKFENRWIKLIRVGFRAYVKIASRIVSYGRGGARPLEYFGLEPPEFPHLFFASRRIAGILARVVVDTGATGTAAAASAVVTRSSRGSDTDRGRSRPRSACRPQPGLLRCQHCHSTNHTHTHTHRRITRAEAPPKIRAKSTPERSRADVPFCSLAVLDPTAGHTVDVLYFLRLYLSSVIRTDSSTGSPLRVLMLSVQAVRGLPRMRAPGIVRRVRMYNAKTRRK